MTTSAGAEGVDTSAGATLSGGKRAEGVDRLAFARGRLLGDASIVIYSVDLRIDENQNWIFIFSSIRYVAGVIWV